MTLEKRLEVVGHRLAMMGNHELATTVFEAVALLQDHSDHFERLREFTYIRPERIEESRDLIKEAEECLAGKP